MHREAERGRESIKVVINFKIFVFHLALNPIGTHTQRERMFVKRSWEHMLGDSISVYASILGQKEWQFKLRCLENEMGAREGAENKFQEEK